ncbi:uncharacterized protein L201_007554 [Kwoniella dendrophila CBS 6074]|uniref:Monooxygenase n=1 Tax=Kwoniella dendrophila CBS 6074 TaxID=1295534 RepID=A0AAX4K6Z5_9TREE
MHIAIVGAGYAGLATASTLIAFGHSVIIFESSPDVGGVWSKTNHYPGLKSQNDKGSYCFSTLSMPKSYPTHPTGEQIQAYLESYVKAQGLDKEGRLRLNTKVVKAEKKNNGWILHVSTDSQPEESLSFDYLICSTGIFNQPNIPSFNGANEFTSSGGTIVHTSNFHKLFAIEDKNVIVVGFGKSACDTAVAASSTAKSVTLAARDVIWKLPTYVGGTVHYGYLLLTRFGEALFPYIRPWRSQTFLNHGLGRPIRAAIISTVSAVISTQLKLNKFGLYPDKPFDTIARSSVSLASQGFVTAVDSGRLKVERGLTIDSLSSNKATLSNGKEIEADVIVCGTGWTNHVPSFLPTEYTTKLLNKDGDWVLYRHTLPIDIPDLAFVGFNSSIFCPLTAEMTSIWLAASLENDISRPLVRIPPQQAQRKLAEEEVAWHRKRTDGHYANGTSIVPFSMSNIDEMLEDLGSKIGWFSYMREWLLPVSPLAYRNILPSVLKRRDTLRVQQKKVA